MTVALWKREKVVKRRLLLAAVVTITLKTLMHGLVLCSVTSLYHMRAVLSWEVEKMKSSVTSSLRFGLRTVRE